MTGTITKKDIFGILKNFGILITLKILFSKQTTALTILMG